MTLIDKAEAHDDDLIRRGDALKALDWGDIYGRNAQERIAALPPAKQDDLASGKAVTVGVKPLVWTGPRKLDEGGAAYDAHTTCGQYIATDTGWFLVGRSGWLVATSLETAKAAAQADYEARILAALEPVTQPAPDADDSYSYDAIEQCERDLDGAEDEPVVNEKLRTMHQEYLQAIADGRLVTDAVSPTDARLRAATAQLDAGDVKEAWEKAYWRMRSYAVHDNDCKLNKPPHFNGPCSCGLTAALEEALALIPKGAADDRA